MYLYTSWMSDLAFKKLSKCLNGSELIRIFSHSFDTTNMDTKYRLTKCVFFHSFRIAFNCFVYMETDKKNRRLA